MITITAITVLKSEDSVGFLVQHHHTRSRPGIQRRGIEGRRGGLKGVDQ